MRKLAEETGRTDNDGSSCESTCCAFLLAALSNTSIVIIILLVFFLHFFQNYVYGVYLNESKVMFYFKTSSNVSYTVQSSLNSYSDGRWYKVHVVRGLKNASLTVRPVGPSDTGAVDYNMITTSTHGYLPAGHAIFFGGKDPNRFVMSLLENVTCKFMALLAINAMRKGQPVFPLCCASHVESCFLFGMAFFGQFFVCLFVFFLLFSLVFVDVLFCFFFTFFAFVCFFHRNCPFVIL